MKFNLAVLALIGNISAKQLIPHDAPIGYILMGEEPEAAPAPAPEAAPATVDGTAPEAVADAAGAAAVATPPSGDANPIPVSAEEAAAADKAANPEKK